MVPTNIAEQLHLPRMFDVPASHGATTPFIPSTRLCMDTSYDANNDGVISASETLLMTDTNANGVIDPNEITDERIAWVVSVGSTGAWGRSLAIAPDGNLWLGLFNSYCYYEISGVDGSILAGPIDVYPNQPYGALVDKYGILWGSSLAGTLARVDTNTYAVSVLNHGYGSDYGIGIGYDVSGNTHVYQANTSGYTYTEYDSGTGVFSVPASYQFSGIGISTDSNGNIFVSNYSGGASFGAVSKFAPTGALIWTTPTHVNAEPRGAIVDSNDDVWVAYRTADVVAKYDGATGAQLGIYPVGHEPYTYSDATGLSLRGAVIPQGTWNTVFDSEASDMPWGTVSWNGSEPAGTSVAVKVRSSNDNVTWSPWEDATSGVALSSTPAGRYLEIQATLKTASADASPILYDLTVQASGQVPPVPELPTVLLLGVGLVGVVGVVGLSLLRRKSQAS
jgi:streptogramin lyase